jgi:hypothetical protein
MRVAARVGGGRVAVGAVGVSHCEPAIDEHAHVVVFHHRGRMQQLANDTVELVAAARVDVCSGELVDRRDRDLTGGEAFADLRVCGNEPGDAHPAPALGVGPAQVGTQVAPHRGVRIVRVQAVLVGQR